MDVNLDQSTVTSPKRVDICIYIHIYIKILTWKKTIYGANLWMTFAKSQ